MNRITPASSQHFGSVVGLRHAQLAVWHSESVLVFGVCVGPSQRFNTVALPGLRLVMDPDDVLVEEQGAQGICAAYNRILAQAGTLPKCEGLVLLHDDVALGSSAREQILAGLRQPSVGVVGAVGGRDLYGPQWVNARRRAGYADDFYGRRNFGPSEADVDVVDGLLLAITPAAFRTIEFDAQTFPAFHGYDTDYCLLVRAAGHRVRVVPIDYVHRDKGGVGDSAAFETSAAALGGRWPDQIRPLGRTERHWYAFKEWFTTQVGSLRHRTLSTIKHRNTDG